ncbi:hypothetical protein SARC_06885, partial [Sphaeroforma arctica JP610]
MLEHLTDIMKPKPEMVDLWSNSDISLKRHGDDQEPGLPLKKVRTECRQRRKSVHFVDAALEEVFIIPAKEETWPYGSLYGESLPRCFEEFNHLYNPKEKCSDKLSVSSINATEHCAPAKSRFNITVGHSYLMYDGSILKAVCATSSGFIGKKFMKVEHIEEQLKSGKVDIRLRPADYVETDEYVAISQSEVAVQCVVSCVGDGDQDMDGLKKFFFGWFYSMKSSSLLPYAVGSKVEVYWPSDQTWYEGVLEDAKDGLHRVVYSEDDSEEYLNLAQFQENGHIKWP